LRESILDGTVDKFLEGLDAGLKAFEQIREKYIIYR